MTNVRRSSPWHENVPPISSYEADTGSLREMGLSNRVSLLASYPSLLAVARAGGLGLESGDAGRHSNEESSSI